MSNLYPESLSVSEAVVRYHDKVMPHLQEVFQFGKRKDLDGCALYEQLLHVQQATNDIIAWYLED